ALAREMGVEPRFTPVRMGEVALKAKRPLFCALSNGKLRAAGIDMPDWQDALRRFVDVRSVSRTVPQGRLKADTTNERTQCRPSGLPLELQPLAGQVGNQVAHGEARRQAG